MFQLKSILLFLSLFITISNHAQYTEEINSNRPGESQSAFSVGKTVIQIEAGVYGIYEKHDVLKTDTRGLGENFNLRVGLFSERLEFNLDIQNQNDKFRTALGTENRNGVRKSILGAKFLLYDPNKNYEPKVDIISWYANQGFKWRQLIPAISIYAGASLNFDSPYSIKDDEKITSKFALITQNQFAGGWVFVSNLIADRIGSKYPSYGYIVTLTKSLGTKWSGFIENQGYNSDFYSDLIFRTGALYAINDDLQIDTSIGSNIKNTPYILNGGFGISWRFDGNHQDELIRVPKKNKKNKNDMKKKKKNRDVNGNPIDPPKSMPKWKDIDRTPVDPNEVKEVDELPMEKSIEDPTKTTEGALEKDEPAAQNKQNFDSKKTETVPTTEIIEPVKKDTIAPIKKDSIKPKTIIKTVKKAAAKKGKTKKK